MHKIIGVGNALTDIVVSLDRDDILKEFKLSKGSMSLVDTGRQRYIQSRIENLPHTMSLGGSAANTVRALAPLDVKTGFIGKVGTDSTGDFFERSLIELSVKPFVFRGKSDSGRCLSLVTPDGERTMVTYLGAALEYSVNDVSTSLFDDYDCLYVEGYQVQDHETVLKTVEVARNCGLTIAIDMASFNVVEENRDFLSNLVEKYVDIVFANEEEARAFSGGMAAQEALDFISSMCSLAVVKTGAHGALISSGGERLHVGILESAVRVDTTGAGDYFAAGFLTGLCEGFSLRQCGTLGSVLAGKVIEISGTTLDTKTWQEIKSIKEKIKKNEYLF